MIKLLCVGTCYMKVKKDDDHVARFEDEYGDSRDVYDVRDNMVQEYLTTGNFKEVQE